MPLADAIVYDVINRQGVLVDRVTIPPTKKIVGFAPGGFVFLAPVASGALIHLERVKWKKG